MKDSTRWCASAMAVFGDYSFTTVKIIKFHTRAQGKSLDRLTVETSFIFGFASFQALPVKIGLGVVIVTRLPWIRSLHSPVL